MLKYRERKLVRAGFIGVVLMILIIAVGLAPEQLVSWATSVRYEAFFADAGGLEVGNKVTVSGMRVGSVTGIELHHTDALVTFTVDGAVPLGDQTTAHVRTGSLLGQRVLTLESAGAKTMRPRTVIPDTRTFAPYSLTDAVGEFTTNTTATNTTDINQAFDTLTATINQIAPELGPTFDGLSRVSQALSARDTALGDLLTHADDVTAILSARSQQIDTMILDANTLTSVLAERRWAIMQLLAHTSAVAQQVSGLVHDNQAKLAPTLAKLNAVTAVLESNRDNIAKALPGLAKYQNTLGETVASGPYYSAYIPNLDIPEILQPFFDYAFGFRRGTNAGQPPDNAGPRAQIPFPYNAIPQGPH